MKRQLHVSGLSMLSKCGEQFRRRYLEGERIPPGVSLVMGTAVHRSVAANLEAKIASGSLLPAEQVQDIARDALAAEWEKGVALEDDYAELGEKKAAAVATDTAVALAKLHHAEAAPGIQPTHVERPWVLEIEGLPVQLAGTIDIQEGLRRIRDTKTSGKAPAADAAATSLQLTTYALAIRQHDGRCPDAVGLDYLIHTKTPKLVQIEARRTDADFAHLLERVYQASRMIEAGLFMPAPIDAWWCSPRWCGYHATCRFAARPVTVAAANGETTK